MPEIPGAVGPLYFKVTGNGSEIVLLLHEYFGTGDSWAPLRSWLARHFRVITPDLTGHGRSIAGRETRLSITLFSQDVLRILDQLQLERVHLIGCSLGAAIASHLALENPSRIRSIAISSLPDPNDAGSRAYAARYVEQLFPKLEESLGRMHGDGNASYARSVLLRNFALDLEELPEDFVSVTSRVGEIGQPALVICGENDPVFPPRRALTVAGSLDDSSLAVLPQTGHLAHQEMPSIVGTLLLDHLLRAGRACT